MMPTRGGGMPTGWEALYTSLADIGAAGGEWARKKIGRQEELADYLQKELLKRQIAKQAFGEMFETGTPEGWEKTGWDWETGLPKMGFVSPFEREKRIYERGKWGAEAEEREIPAYLAGVTEPPIEAVARGRYEYAPRTGLLSEPMFPGVSPEGVTYPRARIKPYEEARKEYLTGLEKRIAKKKEIEEKPISAEKLYSIAKAQVIADGGFEAMPGFEQKVAAEMIRQARVYEEYARQAKGEPTGKTEVVGRIYATKGKQRIYSDDNQITWYDEKTGKQIK